MKNNRIKMIFVLLIITISGYSYVHATPSEILAQYKDLLDQAIKEVVLESGMKAADIGKMSMMGTGSWMKGTNWNPKTSDIDITFGHTDMATELKMSKAIEKRARKIARARKLDPGKINVIGRSTYHPEKYTGETGQAVFYQYSKASAKDGRSAFVFDVAEKNGKITDIRIADADAEDFFKTIGVEVPESYKYSWNKLDMDLHFIREAQFKHMRPPDEVAKMIAKYMDTYDSTIKPGVVDQFAPGKTFKHLEMEQYMRDQMDALMELRRGNLSEADLYKAFGVAKGDTAGLAGKIQKFNTEAVDFIDKAKDQLEWVEKGARKGLIKNGPDAVRMVRSAAKIKKVLFRLLGHAAIAIDVYAVLDAGYNKGLWAGGIELSTALLTAGVPPAAIAGVIAALGKEAFIATGTWAGNALIFDPINNSALSFLYFDTNKSGCNLFRNEASTFAIKKMTRETLSYYFEKKETMANAADLFLNRQFCKGFTTEGAGSIRPLLKSQLYNDWDVSERIGEIIKKRQHTLIVGEITPAADPVRVKINYKNLRPRSKKRSRNFAKSTMSDGRATFSIQVIPQYAQKLKADPRKGDFLLYDAWGKGGSKGAVEYIKSHTRLEYIVYKPARLSLSLNSAKGWDVRTPWGALPPGAQKKFEISLNNPKNKPEMTVRKNIVFIAGQTAKENAKINAKLFFTYEDAAGAPQNREYNFSMSAIPDGKQEPLYSLLTTTVLNKKTGKPIHGARVKIKNNQFNANGSTNASGIVQMKDIPFGEYDVTATSYTYQPFSRQKAMNLKPGKNPDIPEKGRMLIRLTKKEDAEEKTPLGSEQPEEVDLEKGSPLTAKGDRKSVV